MSIFDRFWSSSKKGYAPPAPAPVSAPVANTSERREGTRQNAREGTKVLIIDDSTTVVAVLRKILRSAGYSTREAGDAETGLAMVTQDKPDLVFLDIVLPAMNGFGALRVLRKDPATAHIPVIMISGNEHATEQFYANRIGSDAFMKKPFSRFEVFAHVEALLDENRIPRRKRDPSAPPSESTSSALNASSTAPASTMVPATPPAQPAPPAAPVAPAPVWNLLDARRQLTAMGLQYFSLEQFFAAIERGDLVAVELFVASGGVSSHVAYQQETALQLAQRLGNPTLLNLLQRKPGAAIPA